MGNTRRTQRVVKRVKKENIHQKRMRIGVYTVLLTMLYMIVTGNPVLGVTFEGIYNIIEVSRGTTIPEIFYNISDMLKVTTEVTSGLLVVGTVLGCIFLIGSVVLGVLGLYINGLLLDKVGSLTKKILRIILK